MANGEKNSASAMSDFVAPEERVRSSALYRLPSGLHVIVDPERPFCRRCGDRVDLNHNCRSCGERG